MEPQVRYAKTSDGMNIALAEVGEGPPFLLLPTPGYSHVELSWTHYAGITRGLAPHFHTVWLDFRGTGLSDRDTMDFSMEAMLRDVEAVVGKMGWEKFVLAGWAATVPIAIEYTVRYPERISHLILCDGWSRFSDNKDTPISKVALPLMEIDWQIYSETWGQVLWAHGNPEFGRAFGTLIRASSEPETHRAIWKAWEDYDVESQLPLITAPTLVVYNKSSRMTAPEASKRIAATIPNARLATIDDITYSVIPPLIEEFVLGRTTTTRVAEIPSGTAIILFADIVDSTRLTESMGDAAFREKARTLDEAMRAAIRSNGGTAIEGKTLGDGVLAVFTSARQAITCAQACHEAASANDLALHAGIHAGDVIRESDNVYGGAVNIAARVAASSAPGETLVSDTVRSLARTSAGVAFEDRGEQALKGIDDPVRLFAVREA